MSNRAKMCAWLPVIVLCAGCGATPTDGADPQVTTVGSMEVTAKLVEVPGKFPPNDLYDYAYVLKYEVLDTHRGETPETLYVGQYNPLKLRSEAAIQATGQGIFYNFTEGIFIVVRDPSEKRPHDRWKQGLLIKNVQH